MNMQSYKHYMIMFFIATFVLVCIGLAQAAKEIRWNDLIPCIIQVESSGNPNAYNEKSGAIGLMQITPIVLLEFKQQNYGKKIPEGYNFSLSPSLVDLYDTEFNKYVGTWYLKRIYNHYLPHYKLEQTLENVCIAYNFGIGNLVKHKTQERYHLPEETINYISKVKWLYNREEK